MRTAALKQEPETLTFDQLDDRQKERAREKYREVVEYDLDFLKEKLTEELEQLGFDNVEIHIDVSCCQGSGAFFQGHWNSSQLDTADYLLRNPHMPEHMLEMVGMFQEIQNKCNLWCMRCNMKQKGLYSNNRSVDYNHDWEPPEDSVAVDEDFQVEAEGAFEEACRHYMDHIYRVAEEERDAQLNDESADAYITDNDWLFDEEGDYIED